MYWGKYVQHDNNRDGMGQFLKLTQNIEKCGLDWHPTILHDLHEAQTLLYASTGTGPYNEQLDPITIDEWWSLAENDVLEMTKRGVPGVWTYGFYDGWVPNYMFFVVHAHNATGRFYEVQGYGPDTVRDHFNQSREWFRPNPTPTEILWGPRANTNIQESAILFALDRVAKDKELWLDDYWVKNNNAVNKGKTGPVYGWVIPADQRRKADAADAVNELLDQGLEFHRATTAFKAGNIDVKPGDYIIRGDQPFRTVADIYFSVQNYAVGNPSPYDDTGWTFQYMRDIIIAPCTDKSLLTQPMTPVTGHVQAAGAVAGAGRTIVVEAHGRQQHHHLPLQAEGRDDAGGRTGLRRRRPPLPRRRHCHQQRQPRRRSNPCSSSSVCRATRWPPRRRSGRTTSTSRASSTCTAGAGRRTKGGCGRRSTPTASPTPTWATRNWPTWPTCAPSTTSSSTRT